MAVVWFGFDGRREMPSDYELAADVLYFLKPHEPIVYNEYTITIKHEPFMNCSHKVEVEKRPSQRGKKVIKSMNLKDFFDQCGISRWLSVQ